jgi:hypothetical protein
MRTGPKLTFPSACSHVMCLARSTHAEAARGQSRRSDAVSTSGAEAATASFATGLTARSTGFAAASWRRAADTAAPDALDAPGLGDLGTAGCAAVTAATAAIPVVMVPTAATAAVRPSLLAADARPPHLPVALMPTPCPRR